MAPKFEVTDLLPIAVDAIVCRLRSFEAMREAERQTRQVDWKLAERELAWVETALDLVRSFCFLGKNR